MTKVHTACNSHVTVGHGVGEQLRNGRQLWVVGYEERQRLDPLGLGWHGDEKRDQDRHVVAEAHNAQRGSYRTMCTSAPYAIAVPSIVDVPRPSSSRTTRLD